MPRARSVALPGTSTAAGWRSSDGARGGRSGVTLRLAPGRGVEIASNKADGEARALPPAARATRSFAAGALSLAQPVQLQLGIQTGAGNAQLGCSAAAVAFAGEQGGLQGAALGLGDALGQALQRRVGLRCGLREGRFRLHDGGLWWGDVLRTQQWQEMPRLQRRSICAQLRSFKQVAQLADIAPPRLAAQQCNRAWRQLHRRLARCSITAGMSAARSRSGGTCNASTLSR